MNKPVNIKELIGEMEMFFDEVTTYYHPKSGNFYAVSNAAFAVAEDDDTVNNSYDVEDEEIEIAVDIYENGGDYLELPDKYEINEYAMLEEVSVSVEDDRASRMLQIAINGSGAFRRFKEMVYELGLAQDWYTFRDAQYKKIAIDWCRTHGLDYIEE